MKHKTRWAVVTVVVLALVALGWWGYAQVAGFEQLARAGKTDAAVALKALGAGDAAAALSSFERSRAEFGEARAALGPGWLRDVPWLGYQLDAADNLAGLGQAGATAGVAVSTVVSNASAADSAELGDLLAAAGPQLDATLVAMTEMAGYADRLSTDGLVPPLADAVSQAQSQLEPVRVMLARSEALLTLERYLLGSDHRILLVSQNSAELRPTGGFMGSYGLVEIGPHGFRLEKYADIYTLPRRDTLNLPIPDGRLVSYRHFYLRNSNWWIDFPTSAETMLKLWQNMAQPDVDGVVAIDLPTIHALLKVFGPIKVPEAKQPLTADNMLAIVTEIVEETAVHQGSGRKDVLRSLAERLLQKMAHMDAKQFLDAAAALAGLVNEKHVQLYLSDASAQDAVLSAGWSGSIAPTEGATDLLTVTNAVVVPSKANIDVSKTLDYQVSLAEDGTADTLLTLGYTKGTTHVVGVKTQWLGNSVRASRAPGTVLSGANVAEQWQDATGLPTYGSYFRLDPGESTSLQMRTSVPNALQVGAPPPMAGFESLPAAPEESHYRLLLVKQADLADTTATITVEAPAGWHVVGGLAQWRTSGGVIPSTASAAAVTLVTPLAQDLILDVTLARD